jgi:hypothetical protein
MKSNLLLLSNWARQHRYWAIAILIVAKIMLGYIAFYTGVLFEMGGTPFPKSFFAVLVALIATVYWLYPKQRHASPEGKIRLFYKRKSSDAMLAILTASMWMLIGNSTALWVHSNPTIPMTSAPGPVVQYGSLAVERSNTEQLTKGFSGFKKGFKKWIAKRMLRVYMKFKDGRMAAKVLFSILTFLLALLLLYLVAAISCSLSCSGNEVLAIVVLLVGVIGIVAGVFALLRSIWRPPSDGDSPTNEIDERHKRKKTTPYP